ncbi:hypothetical protein [uncultured Brevundimonas sp.]|uniref:hypothetical protein n=1 Tax=uncultured Brevundimonas sp. TaxID=213418 RepID=UPI0025D59582|nr:hypothetical protein [uncultured Brevundimonas sp.]
MKVLRRISIGALVIMACAMFAFVVWLWPALYVPAVRDFRIVSLDRVEAQSFKPCKIDGLQCLVDLPYDEYLRVRITSDRNLMDFAKAHQLNLWTDVWSCHLEPDRYAGSEFITPNLYVDEIPIPFPSSRHVERFYAATGEVPGSQLEYDVYIVPRWNRLSNAHEAGKERAPPYDISDGRDVCLRMGGGNMLAGHFVGNTVRLSSADIQAALTSSRLERN